MKWQKQVPDKAGYWLRVNAGHRVELKKIWNEPTRGNKLVIIWGWSGEQEMFEISSEEAKVKLGQFYWYGPLPEPPKEAL